MKELESLADETTASGARRLPIWDDDVRIEQVGDRSFTADLAGHWVALKGVHGGYAAAVMVRAAQAVLSDDGVADDTTLRAATFAYLTPNDVGACTIDVDVIRRGRSMVTTHATLRRDGTVTTLGRLHLSAPRDGHRYSDVAPPPPRPAGTIPVVAREAKHLGNVETHLHPDTTLFGGGGQAEWIAWSRPVGTDSLDTAWLTMFGDYFPPAVFARVEQPTPAVTIEYSIQIHDGAGRWTLGADEYLAVQVHAFHSNEGFAVEDARIHLPDGTLLATARQTRLAG